MQNEVRLPRLLDGDFRERRRLRPMALPLTLERSACSTAQLKLPDTEEPLPFYAFLELYTPRGSAGLFRVTSVTDPTFGAYTYPLRHAIDTLHDSVWKEQTDFSGSMAQFLAALLAQQTVPYWQLGQCQDSGSWKREEINYDRLDELLDEVREDRREYMFTYDFSTTPWTLNFVRVSGTVDAEMRLARNLSEGSLRHSREGMGNILYLSISTTTQEADGSPGETTVEYRTYSDAASQAIYGPVEISANVDTDDVSDPDAWAATFLRDHARPIAQASADGWDIRKATGEAWDQLDLGKRCRLAAKRPGFPAAFPIETIKYDDLFGDDPQRVHIDLNRKLPRFSEALAKAREKAEKAGRSAGGAGRKIKEQEKKFQKFETFYTQTNEKFSWLATESEWDELAQAGHVTAFTELTRTARYVEDAAKIELPFDDWKAQWLVAHPEDSGLTDPELQEKYNAWIKENPYAIYNTEYSDATRTERIISKTGINSLGANETLASRIGQEADRITQIVQAVGSNGEVTAASVVLAINNSGSSVTISGDKIYLEGETLTTYLQSDYLEAIQAFIEDAEFTQIYAETIAAATVGASSDMYIDGISLIDNIVSSFGTPTSSGGQISIPYTKFSGATGSINFNIADTQYYQDGVSAARAAGKASVSAYIVNGNNNPVSGRRTLTPGSSMTVYPATYVDGITSRNNDAALVIIAGTTTITVNGWGISAAAGGGTIVSVDVNGAPYTHTFNNYP